ncbi:PaaI family thioesterase [Vibrio parahaemolyticus]|uniref:PaaI family thioesterase n=1 Tax=Vibrio parahaemolyticus TaxID=670 RepID=UPI0023604B26|nr:PaaI family thioesterase [Vibrio parahaemolyticus]HCG5068591.1 PaaI family thioesterase [Vibrio parahaemolyticus]HCG8058802.1 PaaI family thioesterase [Vibrio parahaemolyticus]
MNKDISSQELIPNNHCFGCGSTNSQGLQIHSYWLNENESHCSFTPMLHHCAGPTHILNGGIISTVIDCHCVCTAIAKGYQLQGREIGQGEAIWFATGKLEVSYLKPVPIDSPIELIAKIDSATANKIMLTCSVYSDSDLCCKSTVVAVKVPNSWLNGSAK